MRSFSDDLLAAAHFNGKNIALIDAADGREVNFEAAVSLIDGVGLMLDSHSISVDGCVLSLLPSAYWHGIFFAGVVASGRQYVAMSQESPFADIAACVDTLAPEVVLLPSFAPSWLGKLLADRAVRTIVIDCAEPFKHLSSTASSGVLRERRRCGSLFVRSSGTGGDPRFLSHDIDTLWTAGHCFADFHSFLTSESRFLNLYSFDYLASFFNTLMIPWSVGATVIYDQWYRQRGITAQIWSNVERFDVSVLWITPSMLRGLVDDVETSLGEFAKRAARNLDAVLVGMAPITNAEKVSFERAFGVPVLENYALSETTFLTSETIDSRQRGGKGSVGKVLPWVDLVLVSHDLSGNEKGQVDEISVRLPYCAKSSVSIGGVVEPLLLDDSGFYHTMDCGQLSGDGEVVLTGRLRDIIKRDDGLVQLREIETCAEQHPLVEHAAALAVEGRDDAAAFALFVSGPKLQERDSDIIDIWLHENLPRRMWPVETIQIEKMPLTVNGKIIKDLLPDHATHRNGR